MRQRITFFADPEYTLDPADVKVASDSLTGPDIDGAREDRVTLALEELPLELRKLLAESHELHIRWVASSTYANAAPLSSRLSPGLHIFYTPQSSTDVNA
jgi:hypothetical protein